MVFQYGDITFTRTDAPTEMSLEGSMNYQQMERVKGKPVPQRIGTPLRVMNMTIELKYQFHDVVTTISKLWAKMYGSIEAELIDGAGFSYGQFLIDRIREEVRKTDDKGIVVSATMSLSFIEYAAYDQAADDKTKARKNARATIEAKPIEVKVRPLVVSPQGRTAMGITQSTVATKQAISSVKKANQIPAMRDKYLGEATRQLKTAQTAMQEARQQVDKVTATVSNINQLKTTMDSTIALTTQMAGAVDGADAGDLPFIISGVSSTLESQLKNLTSSAAIITAVTSIRQ